MTPAGTFDPRGVTTEPRRGTTQFIAIRRAIDLLALGANSSSRNPGLRTRELPAVSRRLSFRIPRARVVRGHSNDQTSCGLHDAGAADSIVGVCPLGGDPLAVPAHDGVGRYDVRDATLARRSCRGKSSGIAPELSIDGVSVVSLVHTTHGRLLGTHGEKLSAHLAGLSRVPPESLISESESSRVQSADRVNQSKHPEPFVARRDPFTELREHARMTDGRLRTRLRPTRLPWCQS
jgi:hypothetical protein